MLREFVEVHFLGMVHVQADHWYYISIIWFSKFSMLVNSDEYHEMKWNGFLSTSSMSAVSLKGSRRVASVWEYKLFCLQGALQGALQGTFQGTFQGALQGVFHQRADFSCRFGMVCSFRFSQYICFIWIYIFHNLNVRKVLFRPEEQPLLLNAKREVCRVLCAKALWAPSHNSIWAPSYNSIRLRARP